MSPPAGLRGGDIVCRSMFRGREGMKQVNYILVAMLVCWLVPTAALAKRAPNLELKDLAGNTKRIADLRGSIVVVNFWATWCVPCRAELPMLSELTREYAGKKVRFIAVSADEARNREEGRRISDQQQGRNGGLGWCGSGHA